MGDRDEYFATVGSLAEAAQLLGFEPLALARSPRQALQSMAVHLRDHKLRELKPDERSLEMHYDGFVFAQSQPGLEAARRKALETRYGGAPREARIGGHPGRVYDLGPVPPPDDIDPRMPAVVVWCVADRFFMLASDSLGAAELVSIAGSGAG